MQIVNGRSGWIEVICGPMFSGKSEELIRRLRRAEIARQRIQIFKHTLDARYEASSIVSHSQQSLPSMAVHQAEQILDNVQDRTEVVAIDEAQFLDDGVVALANRLADLGLRVIVAGTDMDFRGEPFGPIPQLLAVAERVDKLHAICVVCGDLATRNQRLIDGRPAPAEGPTIQVGGSESYEARCRACHEVPRRTRDQIELAMEQLRGQG